MIAKVELKTADQLRKQMECSKCGKKIEQPKYYCKDCKLEHVYYLKSKLGFIFEK